MKVDRQLEVGGLYQRQLGGTGTLQDSVDQVRHLEGVVRVVGAIAHEAPCIHERPVRSDGCDTITDGEGGHALNGQARLHDHSGWWIFGETGESGLKLTHLLDHYGLNREPGDGARCTNLVEKRPRKWIGS